MWSEVLCTTPVHVVFPQSAEVALSQNQSSSKYSSGSVVRPCDCMEAKLRLAYCRCDCLYWYRRHLFALKEVWSGVLSLL